jgi:demethylmenaquinone methyltransferase/2-methoxy-6-polyprenyl-1,4-benzoquinol methylase
MEAIDIPNKRANTVQRMFASIAPRYDLTNTIMSLGLCHLWRERFLAALPTAPTVRALDLCTGTGDLLPGLAKRYHAVTGSDFCEPMLAIARERMRKLQRPVTLIEADALALPFESGSFDLVTVAYGVRNFENLERGLKEIHRVLAPGGSVVILEFGQPTLPVFRELYQFYSRFFMPTIGGILTGNREAYRYLPKTAALFPSGTGFLNELSKIGFSNCSARPLSWGVAYIYSATR